MVSGLRRRLLGDVPAPEAEGALVEVWNRVARSPMPTALVFEALDEADDTTLTTLRRIVGRPGWLKLPLVLVFRSAELDGAPAALVGALQRTTGPDCVIRAETRQPAAAPPAPTTDFRALPHEVLRVLRAGALVGSGFEADLVAALLKVEVSAVLDLLQRASDTGVPIEDRGEGRFYLPEPLLDALRASTLPSLVAAQHRRLAELLGGLPGEQEPVFEELPEPLLARAPEPPAVSAPAQEQAGEPGPAPWPYTEIFGGATPPTASSTERGDMAPPPERELPTMTERVSCAEPPAPRRPAMPSRSPGSSTSAPRSVVSRPDDARAAGHLAAAGDLFASAERYLAAAQKAGTAGAYGQALALADKAFAVLEALPESPRRRRLRAAAMLEVGRLRWVSTTPGAEPTLAGAIEVLVAARAALAADDPPQLRAEAAALIAAAAYDIGDAAALERALAELTAASRLLLDAGDAAGAARLLNDQAAVYVRMGDPVRAMHLLGESRRIFESRAAADPVAMAEMAETDHLFARVPLHVQARPGREGDALTMGLDHALAAERAYKKLDLRRELGRVWETMGRLELRKGRLDRARERLMAAVQLEESIGDLVGLARSTAALSELLAAAGRYEEALGVLGDSVALNVEKGSPIGLAYNRRALDALARAADGAGNASEALGRVEQELSEAEALLGRMKLPGETD
jgi:tetratricopeptide (TPR) repeat protein